MILYACQFDSFIRGCLVSLPSTENHKNTSIKESFILSTLHSPITSICQGADLHTIAIGYQSGDVLVGFLDGGIENTSSLYPYGNTYLVSNAYSLKNEFVFYVVDIMIR